jgi:hypothetical protein
MKDQSFKQATQPLKFGLLTIGLVPLFVPIIVAGKITLQHSLKAELKKIVKAIAERYAGIVLAPSDVKSYPHVYFRLLLEAKGYRQVDFAAAMDLKLSGVSDDALVMAMSLYRIPFLHCPPRVHLSPKIVITLVYRYFLIGFEQHLNHYKPVSTALKRCMIYPCHARVFIGLNSRVRPCIVNN